jgi:hypothetical protein
LNSPLSTFENESLGSLSFLVCLEGKRDRKENQERLDSVIIRLDSLALVGFGVLSRFRNGKEMSIQVRNRRLNGDEDDDGDI